MPVHKFESNDCGTDVTPCSKKKKKNTSKINYIITLINIEFFLYKGDIKKLKTIFHR